MGLFALNQRQIEGEVLYFNQDEDELMQNQEITKDTIVFDVMERWPETVKVFLKQKMHCPGCEMAPFETLEEAAAEYNLQVDFLVEALEVAIHEQHAKSGEKES